MRLRISPLSPEIVYLFFPMNISPPLLTTIMICLSSVVGDTAGEALDGLASSNMDCAYNRPQSGINATAISITIRANISPTDLIFTFLLVIKVLMYPPSLKVSSDVISDTCFGIFIISQRIIHCQYKISQDCLILVPLLEIPDCCHFQKFPLPFWCTDLVWN